MDLGASITAHRLFEASVIMLLGPLVGGWDVWTTGERGHKYLVRGLIKHANTLSANARHSPSLLVHCKNMYSLFVQ